ncbi:MAG: hypothetical protein QM784_10365 [Polyangiaceae bacterium]
MQVGSSGQVRSGQGYSKRSSNGHNFSLYTGASTRNADYQNIGQACIDLYRLAPVPKRETKADPEAEWELTVDDSANTESGPFLLATSSIVRRPPSD